MLHTLGVDREGGRVCVCCVMCVCVCDVYL